MNESTMKMTAPCALPVLIAPLQIKTLSELCATYKKTKATIKKWHEEGAPINFDGVNYSADYHLLELWRLKRFSKFSAS